MSNRSTVGATQTSCCAASRPGDAGGATDSPESAGQAFNHVPSFMCQSPPECVEHGRAVPHHTVPEPPPAVWMDDCGRLRGSVHIQSHSGEVAWSVQHLTDAEQRLFLHSSSSSRSLGSIAPTLLRVYSYRPPPQKLQRDNSV